MRMKAKTKTKSCCNVLAVYSLLHFAGRDHFAGVLDGMTGTGDWQLETISPNLFLGKKAFVNSEGEPYDGMIISMSGSARVMEKIAKSRLPTVLVDIPDRTLAARCDAVSWVWTDNADIGRRGALHLLERGEYAAAGYVHELTDEFYSRERMTAFRRTMRENGCETSVFSPGEHANTPKALRTWLRELPKPAAIMAASDMRAADVINACRAEGIAVPTKVAVIGVDYDVSQHARCGMSISSVVLNSRDLGREAVRELEFLLRHPKYKGRMRESLIPAKEIFVGESTARSPIAARLAAAALRDIRAPCGNGNEIHRHELRSTAFDERCRRISRMLKASRRTALLASARRNHPCGNCQGENGRGRATTSQRQKRSRRRKRDAVFFRQPALPDVQASFRLYNTRQEQRQPQLAHYRLRSHSLKNGFEKRYVPPAEYMIRLSASLDMMRRMELVGIPTCDTNSIE